MVLAVISPSLKRRYQKGMNWYRQRLISAMSRVPPATGSALNQKIGGFNDDNLVKQRTRFRAVCPGIVELTPVFIQYQRWVY
ncbi:hypothetical protein KCP77_12675 [Salmonella enterica subsp. enterica]|nr:hypothetical protein KCP77_12675 [Salmonella enterica subsp. enterica]